MYNHKDLLRCGAEPADSIRKRFYMNEEQKIKAQFKRLWKTLSTAYGSKYLAINFLV